MRQATAHTDQRSEADGIRFIGARETERLTAVSRWSLWRWENEGKFPKSLKLGTKRAWIESEVIAWMHARIAERQA